MVSPLRILHVLTHANATRGGAIQALLLARAQVEAGHAVRVVVNSPRERRLDSSFDPWLREGFPIEGFDLGPSGVAGPLESLRFRRLVETWDPDVVHAHRDAALVFVWTATTGMNLPAFVSQRGTTHPFRTRLVARVHASPRVHRIVAVAAAVKNALTSYGIQAPKIDVVYGSFDLERFDPARADRARVRAELGLRDDQPLIVQVGELHRKKGPINFVRVAAMVRSTRPDCVFALVGKGAREVKVRRKIQALGQESGVLLLGFRRDVADIYAAADIAVNCSIGDEGLTGAIREALAMAKPCVATRTDGNPEIVRDGETGYLVPCNDDAAMAAKILEVLAEPERARALGERGRELVLSLMHADVRARSIESVYRAVLAENGQAERLEAAEIESSTRSRARPLWISRQAAPRKTSRNALLQTMFAAGVVLLLALPALSIHQIGSVGSVVDQFLDEGVVAHDEIEDILQNLLDLRGSALEVALEGAGARSSLVPELEQVVESLQRNAAQLQRLELRGVLDRHTDSEARSLVADVIGATKEYLGHVADPEVDSAALAREALSVSARIDTAAKSLGELSDALDLTARVVDAEVPDRLRAARYATLLLALIALVGAVSSLIERRTRPN
jgi:glycosyltransferase involved in cell wall biosynthesis